jgi:hypothetical protein
MPSKNGDADGEGFGIGKNIAKHIDALQRVFALAVQYWSCLGSIFLGDQSNAQSRDLGGRGHGHGRLLKQRQHQTGSDQL